MQSGHTSGDAGLTVAQILDAYLAEHAELNIADPRRQRDGIVHLKKHLGGLNVAEVDIPACREYRKKRSDAAASTVRRELNILGAAANHARKWKRLPADQMPQLELPRIGKSEKVMWFTKEQVSAMFRARNSGHFACFLRICYFTAARRRSVESLTKEQIDLLGGVIHLAKAGERVTKKRRPSVPLYPEIRPAVEWLMGNSGRSPHLFGRARDFYRSFAELMEEMGIEGHPHMLRHSRATHMLMDGDSIYRVARLLGDTVATVERVYGHCDISHLLTSSSVAGGDLTEPVRAVREGEFKRPEDYAAL
jgi:integrase